MNSDTEKSYHSTMVILIIIALIIAIIALGFYIYRSSKPHYPTPIPIIISSPVPLSPINLQPLPPGSQLNSQTSLSGRESGAYERRVGQHEE